MEKVAAILGMPLIRVLEVATFYTMFHLEPVGAKAHVLVCGTTPCMLAGAGEIIDVCRSRIHEHPHHRSPDGAFSWEEVECMGACVNAPMVQINKDYYEDLTPEILDKLLDDLAAGRAVKPGPQQGRRSSEPAGAVNTLQDPSLYDGSLIGAWHKRFEEQAIKEREAKAVSEAAVATATAASEPKPAKPDSGRAIESEAANTPAKKAKEGETPVKPDDPKGAADPSKATVVPAGARPEEPGKPQSEKSYTPTPSKPEEGRPAADAKPKPDKTS
jgi:NADH-quinone oxidoreductase subunit E